MSNDSILERLEKEKEEKERWNKIFQIIYLIVGVFIVFGGFYYRSILHESTGWGIVAIGLAIIAFGFSFGKIGELRTEITRQHILLTKYQGTIHKKLEEIERELEEK